jgi:hypothetical protein
VHQLAVLARQVEDPLQRRQLAVDLSIGIPPFLAFVIVADDHHILLPLQNERVHVGRSDRREASTAEVGEHVQSNPSLEFVSRSPSVHGVFGSEILRRFVEANPIQLRIHRQAVRDVAFA